MSDQDHLSELSIPTEPIPESLPVEEHQLSGMDVQIATAVLDATVEVLEAHEDAGKTQTTLLNLKATVGQISHSSDSTYFPNVPPLIHAATGRLDSDLVDMAENSPSAGIIRSLFASYFGKEAYKGALKKLETERKSILRVLSERTSQLEDVMAYNDIPSPEVRRNRAQTSFGLLALIRSAPSYFTLWHQFAEIRTGTGIDPMKDKPYGQLITMDPGAHYSEDRLGEEITDNLQSRELPTQIAMLLYKEIHDFFSSKRGANAESMQLILWKEGKPFFVSITKEQFDLAGASGTSLLIAEISRMVTLCQSGKIPADSLPTEVLKEMHYTCYQKFSKATKDPFIRSFYGNKHLSVILDSKPKDSAGYIKGKETDPRMLTGGFLHKTIAFTTESDALDNHLSQVLTRFNHRLFHGGPGRSQLTQTLEGLADITVDVEDLKVFQEQEVLPHFEIKGFEKDSFLENLPQTNLGEDEKLAVSKWRKAFDRPSDVFTVMQRDDILGNERDEKQSYLPPEWFETYEVKGEMYKTLLEKIGKVRELYQGVERQGKEPSKITLADIFLMAMHPAGRIRTANSIAEHAVGGYESWDTYFNTFPDGFFKDFDNLLDKLVTPPKRETRSAPANLTPDRLEEAWKTFLKTDNSQFLTRLGSKLQMGFAIMHREKFQAAKGEGTQSFFSTLVGRISYLEDAVAFVSKQSVMVGNVITDAVKNPQGMISIMSGMKEDETEYENGAEGKKKPKAPPKLRHLQFASAQDEVYLRTLTENGYSGGFGIYGITGNNVGWENEGLTISERMLQNQLFEELAKLAMTFAHDPRYGFALEDVYSKRLGMMKKGYEVFLDVIRTSIYGDNPHAMDEFFSDMGWDYYKHEFIVLVNKEIHAHMRQNMERLVASSYFLLSALEDHAKAQGATAEHPLKLQFRNQPKENSTVESLIEKNATSVQTEPIPLKKDVNILKRVLFWRRGNR